jgi:hypothetical protein
LLVAMPVSEEMAYAPISPYGRSKMIVEGMLRDYEAASGMRSIVLRYFNASGADPAGEPDIGFAVSEGIDLDRGAMQKTSTNFCWRRRGRRSQWSITRAMACRSMAAIIWCRSTFSSRRAGTLIAFATAPGQVALDGEGANSPFSAALSRHIGTPGLEVRQMLTRVRAEVVATTKSKQVPWSNSSLLGEVYLAEK